MISNQGGDNLNQVKCIKSLYKSTYKKNAFTKGQKYAIHISDSKEYAPNVIFIVDSTGHSFNFTLVEPDPNPMGITHGMYKFSDYFSQ